MSRHRRSRDWLYTVMILFGWAVVCYAVITRDWWVFATGAFAVHILTLEGQGL